MDALLSLPLLSFLLIPAYGSYSTSLNLLFFYLTWSTLILSHSALKVELLSTLFIRILFYVLPALFFLAFDAAIPSLAVNIKYHGDVALPLRQERRNGAKWWRVVGVSLTNVLLAVGVQTGIAYLCTDVLHVRSALKVTTTLPMPWGIAKDLLRGFALRELLTYIFHRYILHHPSSPLTSLHKTWYHRLPAPYSFCASYDHPLPYLMRSFFPTYLPAILFRFHLLTYLLYLSLISLEELFTYSGYNVLPSGFILGGMARRTERHLMGGGRGNFGAVGLVDLLAGTSLGSDVVDDVVEEAERRDVKGRVTRKVGKTGRKVRRRVEEYVDEDDE